MKDFWKPLCVIVVTLVFALPASVGGEAIQCEAEDTLATYDYDGDPIQVINSPGCVGTVLYGLDAVGEWAEYHLPITDYGRSRFWIRCRGDAGYLTEFQATFTGDHSGSTQTVDFEYTGQGFP